MRGSHSYTSYTEPQPPLLYLTYNRLLNRNKWKTPSHYYSNLYKNLHQHPLTHHYEHTSIFFVNRTYIPCNKTPF